jgi:hypothetical protein
MLDTSIPGERPATSESPTKDDSKRVVMVATVPVRTRSYFREFMTLLTWLFGSQLTWAIHWALVDKTAFKLQRPRGREKPYLKASIWPEESRYASVSILSPAVGMARFTFQYPSEANYLLMYVNN